MLNIWLGLWIAFSSFSGMSSPWIPKSGSIPVLDWERTETEKLIGEGRHWKPYKPGYDDMALEILEECLSEQEDYLDSYLDYSTKMQLLNFSFALTYMREDMSIEFFESSFKVLYAALQVMEGNDAPILREWGDDSFTPRMALAGALMALRKRVAFYSGAR